MNLTKKLAKVLSVIFLASLLASCDKGCVQSNEFEKKLIQVSSYPLADGINGSGTSESANWHETGLKSNGGAITLEITGAWVPWYGNTDYSSDKALSDLPVCSFCSMNSRSTNCICHLNQVPESEDGYAGTDCQTNTTAENDIEKCTCSRQFGSATDYGVYHFPLNYYNKYKEELKSSAQSVCKYNAGMSLYIGLFGKDGITTPTRIYQLFSQTEVCDVTRNSAGECLDADGNDVTKYIFTSANNKIFVKDDGEGNSGADTNLANNSYHERNEVVKMIILDDQYTDNYGVYDISFLGGVGTSQDKGLLEFLVSLIEDKIMGTEDEEGIRQGGIIETMFNQIVRDSGFIAIVQICLSIYITFYGVSVLIGLAEVSKKELMNRMLKIALVIFFTSSTSWYWYNHLVVSFFKESMDYVISIFMSFSDQNLDPTSGIITAQMDRASSNSNATRFSYADLIIRNLLSVASAKKIFGLFFGVPLFGIVYIAAIFALIAFFIYVMLSVAMFYVLVIIKLAFVLALGPIFIAFTLSSHTNDMFKKWLSFVGARSLEVIFLFLILYNFLVLIDQHFTSLLSYKACVTNINLGLFSIPVPILKSDINRSLVQWFSSFILLGGLIFITKLVIDKIPDLVSGLITIGGSGASGTSMGGGNAILGGVMGVAQAVGNVAAGAMITAGAKAYQGVSTAMTKRQTGESLSKTSIASRVLGALPSSPREMYRNSIVDSAISKAQKEVAASGLKGAAADQKVREMVVANLTSGGGVKGGDKSTTIGGSPNASIAAGLNLDTISKRLDEKLITKPLTDFIKSKSAELKASSGLIGKDLRDKMNSEINSWADKNIYGGRDAVKDIMNDKNTAVNGIRFGGLGFNNMKEFIRNQTEYSAAEAAKAFSNNSEKQKEYLQHLQANQFKLQNARDKAGTLGKAAYTAYDYTIGAAAKTLKPLDNAFGIDSLSDTKRAASSFLRKVSNEENKSNSLSDYVRSQTGSWLHHNQGSALNPLNLAKSKAAIRQEITEGNREGLANYLSKNAAQKEQDSIKSDYDKKIAEAPNYQAKKALEKKRDQKLEEIKDKRNFFKKELEKNATKFAKKDSVAVDEDLKKISALEKSTREKFRQQVFNKGKLLAAETRKNEEKEIEKQRKKLADLEKSSLDKSTADSAKKISQEREKLEKMEKEYIIKKSEQKTKDDIKDKIKADQAKLEEEKKREITEILRLKTETKSLEDVIKDIKDLQKDKLTIQENIASKLAYDTNDIEERKARGEEYKKSLADLLKREHQEALENHLTIQKQLLNLSAEEEKALQKLSGKALQKAIDDRMEKRFPSNPKLLKQREDALKALSADQKKILLDNGGIETIKEGLVEINGTTLFEKTARLNLFIKEFPEIESIIFGSTDTKTTSHFSGEKEETGNIGSTKDEFIGVSAFSSSPQPEIFREKIANRDLFTEEGKILPGENFLSIVGLDSDAEINDVRKAFRKIAFKYHPDRNDNKEATQVFQEINKAYINYIDKYERLSASSDTNSDASNPASNSTGNSALSNANSDASNPTSILEIQSGVNNADQDGLINKLVIAQENEQTPAISDIVRAMNKEEIKETINEIKESAERKIKNKEISSLKKEAKDLKIITDSLAVDNDSNKQEDDKKEDTKEVRPDLFDKNKLEKSSMLNLLNVQLSIVNANIADIRAKKDKEKANLEELRKVASSVGGSDDRAKKSEDIIAGFEKDIDSLQSERAQIIANIDGIRIA